MFKNLSNLGSLLKQAQNIGGQLGNLTEKLKQRRTKGMAGGGMVEIEVNGILEVLRCTIDPALLAQNDRELLEDLVAAAVNQAITNGKQLHAEAMRDLTGGIELPGLDEAMAKFMGSAPDEMPLSENDQPDADSDADDNNPINCPPEDPTRRV